MLLPPLSCEKLFLMDLKLKPEFEGSVVRRFSYPARQDQTDEIERKIQEFIDAGFDEEYKHWTIPAIVALVSMWLNLVPLLCAWTLTMVRQRKDPEALEEYPEYGEQLGENRQVPPQDEDRQAQLLLAVDLTRAAQELLAFVTPKGRVFRWKAMPFGVANAPALFQELINKILYILSRRPLVQEQISFGAEMEAHIDQVSLGTNTQEDHILLLQQFFTICQKHNVRIGLEKCEFIREEME